MSTRRRKWLTILAAALLPLVGFGVNALIPPKPGVTLENFRRLHKGMTLEQAEAILGTNGCPDEETPDDRIQFWWEGTNGENLYTITNGNQIVLRGYYYDRNGHALEELSGRVEGVMERAWNRAKEWVAPTTTYPPATPPPPPPPAPRNAAGMYPPPLPPPPPPAPPPARPWRWLTGP